MLRILAVAAACLSILLFPPAAIAAEPSAWMDAAETFLDGTEMDGFAAVRLFAQAGDADLTNVRFQIVVHAGTLHNSHAWLYGDPTCPWHLVKPMLVPRGDGTFWTTGLLYYPRLKQFAPIYLYDLGDGNTEEIRDTVPAGFTWDVAIKLEGLNGEDIELFTEASGDLTSDTWSTALFDSDRSPQSVPEPAAIALLAAGAALLTLRRPRTRTHAGHGGLVWWFSPNIARFPIFPAPPNLPLCRCGKIRQ